METVSGKLLFDCRLLRWTMKPTKEVFKTLSNKERLEVIQNLDSWFDRDKISELLLSVGISTLDSHLLGELVKVYNNTGERV